MLDFLFSLLPDDADWKGFILRWVFGTLVVGGLALFFIRLFAIEGTWQIPHMPE